VNLDFFDIEFVKNIYNRKDSLINSGLLHVKLIELDKNYQVGGKILTNSIDILNGYFFYALFFYYTGSRKNINEEEQAEVMSIVKSEKDEFVLLLLKYLSSKFGPVVVRLTSDDEVDTHHKLGNVNLVPVLEIREGDPNFSLNDLEMHICYRFIEK
jgi:hypothetical protein